MRKCVEALLQTFSIVLAIVLPHRLIQWDERRLSPAERRRHWNDATHWVAVVGFNWLAVVVYFIRTRRSWRGAALGLLWACGGIALQACVLLAVQWALGLA
jgi:hypothetical protein